MEHTNGEWKEKRAQLKGNYTPRSLQLTARWDRLLKSQVQSPLQDPGDGQGVEREAICQVHWQLDREGQ